jgi:hypothetical protein
MSQHLPILQAMFPSKILLGPAEIASVLDISAKHVYHLASKGKLGFKLAGITDKTQVSIVELARYLDEKTVKAAEPKPVQDPPPTPVPQLIKKKLGRPRGQWQKTQ